MSVLTNASAGSAAAIRSRIAWCSACSGACAARISARRRATLAAAGVAGLLRQARQQRFQGLPGIALSATAEG